MLGAVAECWVCVVDCELAAPVVQTGRGCWVLVLGAVSWLRAWWKQGAGCWLCACGAVSWRAGAGCARGGHRVPPGCWCSLCAWCRLGAGAGCWRWLTRHAVLHVKIGVAANAGCSPEKSFACFCYLGSNAGVIYIHGIRLRHW